MGKNISYYRTYQISGHIILHADPAFILNDYNSMTMGHRDFMFGSKGQELSWGYYVKHVFHARDIYNWRYF